MRNSRKIQLVRIQPIKRLRPTGSHRHLLGINLQSTCSAMFKECSEGTNRIRDEKKFGKRATANHGKASTLPALGLFWLTRQSFMPSCRFNQWAQEYPSAPETCRSPLGEAYLRGCDCTKEQRHQSVCKNGGTATLYFRSAIWSVAMRDILNEDH